MGAKILIERKSNWWFNGHMARPKTPLSKRFFAQLEKGELCWIWIGAISTHGYGKLTEGGKTMLAHRVSFNMHYGPIPDGMLVCHSCDNRKCVNPKHLFLGTIQDNNADMCAKNRHAFGDRSGAKTKPDSIRKGELNGRAVLRERDILEIRGSTLSQRKEARKRGVSKTLIGNIRRGDAWKCVH